MTALAEEINHPASAPSDLGAQAGNEAGAASVSRGKLYYLLSNPVYIGKLRHHKQLHDGEHQAIVDPTTFEQVQALLRQQAPLRTGRTNSSEIHLLTGILFDEAGCRLNPTFSNNHGKGVGTTCRDTLRHHARRRAGVASHRK